MSEPETPAGPSGEKPMSKLALARAAAAKTAAEAAKSAPSSEAPAGGKPMSKLEIARAAAAKKGAEAGAGGGEAAAAKPTSKLEAARAAATAQAGSPAAKKEPKGASASAATKPTRPAAKPERPKSAGAGAAGPTRRTFFLLTWFGVAWAAFIAGCSAAVLAGVRFLYPNVLEEPPSVFKVGPPDRFEEGNVYEQWKNEYGVWLVRNNGALYAIRSVCTHLGCTPNWLEAEQKFKCPCHGSGFRKTGVNFEGPAPRPLERYAIAIADDGQVQIDKSKKFQQELGQWTEENGAFIKVG